MTTRRALALLVVALATTAIAVLAPSALGRSQAKATVTATDFKFKWVPARLTRGVATITVVNRGQATHDLKIAGKKTKILNPGQRATLKVTLKKGTYAHLCTVPGHAALGMKGKLVVR
jgi:plastocyanin